MDTHEDLVVRIRTRSWKRVAGFGLALFLGLPAAGPAQDLQLSGFTGWRFGGSGRSPVSLRETDIDGARSFGGTLSVGVLEQSAVELYFSRAEAPARRLFGDEELDVTLSYVLLGIVHDLRTEGVRPFAGFAIGGARLDESPGGADTLFAAGGILGVRYLPTAHVGLRAEGRLLFVSYERERSRSRDTLGGADLRLGGDAIIQAELSVGLVLAF